MAESSTWFKKLLDEHLAEINCSDELHSSSWSQPDADPLKDVQDTVKAKLSSSYGSGFKQVGDESYVTDASGKIYCVKFEKLTFDGPKYKASLYDIITEPESYLTNPTIEAKETDYERHSKNLTIL